MAGALTSFLNFPVWTMGAKAPIRNTSLVNLASHFPHIHFEHGNARQKLYELFFLAFSLLHNPRVDIYRYTEYFLSYPDNNEEPKKHTTQKNVPRQFVFLENTAALFEQLCALFIIPVGDEGDRNVCGTQR